MPVAAEFGTIIGNGSRVVVRVRGAVDGWLIGLGKQGMTLDRLPTGVGRESGMLGFAR